MSITTEMSQNKTECQGMVKLKCKGRKTVMSNEAGIVFNGIERRYESLMDADFFQSDEQLSLNEDVDGFVVVEIVKESGDAYLVELPRQVVMGGRRVWVPSSSIDRT